MSEKNARVDIKTTQSAKALLQQAADVLGTTLSAFLLESAMARAKEIIHQSHMINLNRQEAEKFVSILTNPPKASKKLQHLFEKYSSK